MKSSEQALPEIGVIDRSAAILAVLQDAPMTAAEVCRRLGYSKSTTYRLLTDLRAHRFIVRDSSGLLRLGPFPGRRNIATTNSVLEHLRAMTGESVQLWVRVGEDRVCVRNVEADHELRVSRGVGAVLPLVDGGSAALALCGPGNPAEFYATKQARVAGTASASVAFTVGAIVFALCVSYPLTGSRAMSPVPIAACSAGLPSICGRCSTAARSSKCCATSPVWRWARGSRRGSRAVCIGPGRNGAVCTGRRWSEPGDETGGPTRRG